MCSLPQWVAVQGWRPHCPPFFLAETLSLLAARRFFSVYSRGMREGQSDLRTPRLARLPGTTDPTTNLNSAGSRYERGTQGGQVTAPGSKRAHIPSAVDFIGLPNLLKSNDFRRLGARIALSQLSFPIREMEAIRSWAAVRLRPVAINICGKTIHSCIQAAPERSC